MLNRCLFVVRPRMEATPSPKAQCLVDTTADDKSVEYHGQENNKQKSKM